MNYLLAVVVIIMALLVLRHVQARRREAYIDALRFHPAVLNKFREVRPNLSAAQVAALRDYFRLCRRAGRRMVAMPSQVVNDAWHAFILYTRGYEQFSYPGRGDVVAHLGPAGDQTRMAPRRCP